MPLAPLLLSDNPVLLGQYSTGASASPGAAEGNPSFVLLADIESWLATNLFYSPPSFAHNYLALVSQGVSATFTLDGAPIDAAHFPGLSSRSLNQAFIEFVVPVGGGSHSVSSNATFGTTIYGYDLGAAYNCSGGRDLARWQIRPGE